MSVERLERKKRTKCRHGALFHQHLLRNEVKLKKRKSMNLKGNSLV